MSQYAAAHVDPQGPGDVRPTAIQIVEDEGLVGKLSGKVALVTGANQGIGLETARALHAAGATVFLTARDAAKGQQGLKSIKNGPGPKSDAPLYALELRLDSLASVRVAAKAFLSQSDRLHLLILNAGVMATPEGKTEDGFETQLGTNHFGHFLLFQLLKATLLSSTSPTSSSQARVVTLSSMAHRASGIRFDDLNFEKEAYNPWLAYGQSKTASIYLANEIERRYGSKGLHALSVHPGVIQTNLGQFLTPEQLASMDFSEAVQRGMKSPPQGAATTVYAALSKEWEGRGGKYLSNCAEEPPANPNTDFTAGDGGYAPWAYDVRKATRFWEVSSKLVGVEDSD